MKEKKSVKTNYVIFLKSMLYTAAAIALVVIGYYSAMFFFGEIYN